ncbi:hypothetical protein Hamer_G008420 [Homarus americanus]|uniref:Uncharacterized protein n=1 Tax=Homarus americanus TaxID=6706 RepID=A0A8J5TKX8_HOMAM|nr:hypothetical protein Hamer_G008420 [Homarus americanus]
MVHRKSTYRLMFRNYGAEVRQKVWHENNSLRMRRREEEMSHQSIEESDSDCVCDEEDDEEPEPPPSTPNDTGISIIGDGTSEKFDDSRGSMPNLNLTKDTGESTKSVPEPRSKSQISGDQLGVMRPGSRVREYDLIPAVSENSNAPGRGATLAKSGLAKSHLYPLTSKLSRTTRRNFHERDKINYVPYGTGASVRTLGDKTSFNIHLNKDRVRPTSLTASSLRNREIERLIRKQKQMTLDDWRDKGQMGQPVNHSSLWATDTDNKIFSSKARRRERVASAPSRVEVFSNYCKHCGGKK